MVVLTKADLSDDAQGHAASIGAVAAGVPVLTLSAREGVGLGALLAELGRGETGVLIGSSGVGKSTLVNALLGEARMATDAIRGGDDHGRHTTSHRELILLPGGGLILDTPGIREVGLVEADEGTSVVFDDVERLIAACRFNDCRHEREPGCAVQAALRAGDLDPARLDHFNKLAAEAAVTEAKAEAVAKADERRRLVGLRRGYRAAKRDSRGDS